MAPPPPKSKSNQSKICQALWKLMSEFTCPVSGEQIFKDQIKGTYYNKRMSLPEKRFPCCFIYVVNAPREAFGINRQDLRNININIEIYTMDTKENDMDQHYLWMEGLDRVLRNNPRLTGDLGVSKATLEDPSYEFGYDDAFLISQSVGPVSVQIHQCLGQQIC